MHFRKVHHFWKRCKPLLKMMHTFLEHFWIFELTHNVFEFGHLIVIIILNAQIILKLNVGHWNNSTSVHK
jgi:hypothetical protein